MKSNQIEVPDVTECLVSKAAAFFAPDYAPNMFISEWQVSQQEDYFEDFEIDREESIDEIQAKMGR